METKLTHLALHIIGNKAAEEGVHLAKSNVSLSEELRNTLSNFFLNAFNIGEFFHLYHDSGLEYNVVHGAASKIFEDPSCLYEESKKLARYLYEQSTHPKIKAGEFYVAYFTDCMKTGELVDAVGIFKTENKDTYLKVGGGSSKFSLESEQGINIKKLDKGCLIFNRDIDDGYVVSIVDNTNKGMEALYWTDDFLHVRQRKDEYANTQNVMAMAKNFVTQELPKEFEVSKADQIDLLNKSLQFFKEKDSFDFDEFAAEVIEQPDVIESFQNYKKNYEEENGLSIDDNFMISNNAFKKQQRSYKRVIRLDDKIQIIIDGNRDHVEQGEDARGKYYKVYYTEEE